MCAEQLSNVHLQTEMLVGQMRLRRTSWGGCRDMKSFHCSADKSLDLMRGEMRTWKREIQSSQKSKKCDFCVLWMVCFLCWENFLRIGKKLLEGFQVLKGIWVLRDTEQMWFPTFLQNGREILDITCFWKSCWLMILCCLPSGYFWISNPINQLNSNSRYHYHRKPVLWRSCRYPDFPVSPVVEVYNRFMLSLSPPVWRHGYPVKWQ